MKLSDPDHNAQYWASKNKKGDRDANAYWKRATKNVDRIDNLKKLLARAHKELKNSVKD